MKRPDRGGCGKGGVEACDDVAPLYRQLERGPPEQTRVLGAEHHSGRRAEHQYRHVVVLTIRLRQLCGEDGYPVPGPIELGSICNGH